MATRWSDLKHKSSADRREEVKQQALDELNTSEQNGMAVLRTARHQTQVELAEQMHIPQSAVSRMERQKDHRLSTLQRYVAALGGRLELQAVFPDGTVDLNNLVHAVRGERVRRDATSAG